MFLDRTQAPAFKPIEKIFLPDLERDQLSNRLKVYTASYKKEEVVKIELVFPAGNLYSKQIGLGSLYPKMLFSGTKKFTSKQVFNLFDQWGGFTEISQKVERLHISVYGLTKYFEKYVEGINEILLHSIFPESELEIQKNISIQNIRLSNEKPNIIAGKLFRKSLFGSKHPLGQSVEESDIDTVNSKDLIDFHEKELLPYEFQVFLAGDVPQNSITVLNNYFGGYKLSPKPQLEVRFEHFKPNFKVEEKKDSLQSTIRIGKQLFGRTHPDIYKFFVTNTIFGGYFGSRLMKNIREEKGYTYGISSGLIPTLQNHGYFIIGADVVKENTKDTINEIKKELEILRQDKVSEIELETVKNYMIGNFASGVNNSFDIMDKQRKLILNNWPVDYYASFISKIREVSREDVYDMANAHLNYNDFTEIIVGEAI